MPEIGVRPANGQKRREHHPEDRLLDGEQTCASAHPREHLPAVHYDDRDASDSQPSGDDRERLPREREELGAREPPGEPRDEQEPHRPREREASIREGRSSHPHIRQADEAHGYQRQHPHEHGRLTCDARRVEEVVPGACRAVVVDLVRRQAAALLAPAGPRSRTSVRRPGREQPSRATGLRSPRAPRRWGRAG